MLKIEHDRDSRQGRKGGTIVREMGPDTMSWTGRYGLADLLEIMGTYIDYAKIWGLNAATLPQSYVKEITRQYKEVGAGTFAGGILFEYAFLKDELEGMVDLLKHLDIDGIEVSENYLTLSHKQRLAQVENLRRAGMEVVFEFGRKKPETPMSPSELHDVVEDILSAGAHHVILEQSEFDLLEQSDPEAASQMLAQDWFQHVYLEADPHRFPRQHAELINRFGSEINLANIAPGQVLWLENFRRGLGRAVDFPFIREMAAAQTG